MPLSGGCMCLPHPGHDVSDQGHSHIAAGGPTLEAETAAKADRSYLESEKDASSSFTPYYGLVDPRDPLTWLAGGGMALMMALMVF